MFLCFADSIVHVLNVLCSHHINRSPSFAVIMHLQLASVTCIPLQ